jgi:cysteine synthase
MIMVVAVAGTGGKRAGVTSVLHEELAAGGERFG